MYIIINSNKIIGGVVMKKEKTLTIQSLRKDEKLQAKVQSA